MPTADEEIERLRVKVEVLLRVVRDMSVDVLEHEVRKPALGALRRNRIFTLGQLERCTPDRLCRMRNFGVTALREVRGALELRGLALDE